MNIESIEMKDILIVAVGILPVLGVLLVLLIQQRIICKQSSTISSMFSELARVELAKMAFDASRETGSIIGPAVLQQIKKEEAAPPKVEETKKTGVTLKY